MEEFDVFYVSFLFITVLFLVGLIYIGRNKSKFQNHKLFRLILWNSLLTAFLISTVFIIGESYYRFFEDSTDSFAVTKVAKRWLKRHYHPNNIMVRDDIDYSMRCTPGKRRISIIGDSFTAGHGIKNVDNRFANILRENNPEFEIHVLANNGMETNNHLDIVNRLINQGYEFDLVILAYNLNDIAYLLPQTNKLYDKMEAYEKDLGFWARNSYWVNLLQARSFANETKEVGEYYSYLSSSYSNNVWGQQRNVLLELKRVIESQKARMGVVVFPFLTNLNEEYSFLNAHENLRKLWTGLNIHYLDLMPVYKKYSTEELIVNENDPHPNEFAHKIAAEKIQGYFIDPPAAK